MKSKWIEFYFDIARSAANLSTARRLQVGCVIVRDHQILATGYNGTPSGWDNNCEDQEWCSGDEWLSPEEIESGWPHEGTYIDVDGVEISGRYRLKTKPEVLHAEMNALMKIARSTESTENSVLFCTHAPCIDCAKAIFQAGISKVYYLDQYKNDIGLEFLRRGGIDVHRAIVVEPVTSV